MSDLNYNIDIELMSNSTNQEKYVAIEESISQFHFVERRIRLLKKALEIIKINKSFDVYGCRVDSMLLVDKIINYIEEEIEAREKEIIKIFE